MLDNSASSLTLILINCYQQSQENSGRWHRPSPTQQQAINGQSPGLDNPAAAVHSRVEMND